MSEPESSPKKQIIDREVSRLFAGSAAFSALSPEIQREIEKNTAEILDRMSGALVSEVDFPAFVASLVKGVFGAIVNSSIQQMKAYGDMVQSVAQSLDEFDGPGAAPRTKITRSRQQLLSTMVLMGINRIIVTDGKINAKMRFATVDDATYARRVAACQRCPHLVDPKGRGLYHGIGGGGAAREKICELTGGPAAMMVRLVSEACPDPDPADPGKSRWGEARTDA